MLVGEPQRRSVGRGEQLRLTFPAAAPDRAHGVNHVLRRQTEAGSDAGLPGGALPYRGTGARQLRTRGPMDRAAHAATRGQCLVGRVHDGVRVESGDVYDSGGQLHNEQPIYPRRLKNCTARSCRSAAARVANVPRFRRFPVLGSCFRE